MQPQPPPYTPPPGSGPPVQQAPPGAGQPPDDSEPRRSHSGPAGGSKVLAAAVGAGALIGLVGGMAIASGGDDVVATTPSNATTDPNATPSPAAGVAPGTARGNSGEDSPADQWGTPPSGQRPGVQGLPSDDMTPPSGSTGGSQ